MADFILKIIADSANAEDAFARLKVAGKSVANEAVKNGEQQKQATQGLTNSVGNLTTALGLQGTQVGAMANSFKGVTTAVSGFTKGLNGIKAALISTGIGAFVVAIGTLIAYFTKTEAGAEKLERVMARVGAVFNVVVGAAVDLGKSLFNAFTNPIASINKLIGAVLNPIQAFKTLGNAIGTVASNSAKAAEEAGNIAGEFQDLEKTTIKNSVAITEYDEKIKLLIIQLKNKSNTEKEGLKISEDIAELEGKSLELKLQTADKEIELIKRENELKKANKDFGEEDLKKENDAINKRAQLIGESAQILERKQNKDDALKAKFAAEEETRNEKALEAIEKKTKAQTDARDNLLKDEKRGMEQALAENLKAFADGKINEQQYNDEIFKIKQTSLELQLGIQRQANSKFLDTQGEQIDLSIEKANLESAETIRLATKTAAELKKERDKNTAESDKWQEEENAKQIKDSEAKVKRAEAEQAIEQAKLDFAGTVTSGLAQLLSQDEASRKKHGAALKALALAEIAINLSKQISGILAHPANIASLGTLGIIQTAIAIANAAFNVATVTKQQFYKGGFTGEGDKYEEAGTVHRGEFVSTAKTTKKHRTLLEAIHSNDYSDLTPFDLAPILRGAGVVFDPIIQERIITDTNDIRAIELNGMTNMGRTNSEIGAMRKEITNFTNHYKNKTEEKVMPDGSVHIKKGSSTRIIRPN